MKIKKGSRKAKSKRGHRENATARFKSHFVNGERYIVPIAKSSLPTTKLKESAEVMRGVFPESNELLSNTVLPSPKGVKEAVEELRHKAEVVPIGISKSTSKPVILSDSQIIANLERVIKDNLPATNEESAFTGPPKPTVDSSAWMPKHSGKLSVVHGITGDEDVGKSTPTVVPEQADDKAWVKLHGTCIIDTGDGMTPSGKPITDFLEGGAEELALIMKKIKSHSVTVSSDYTHEELAELYDMQQVEMHELKLEYDKRIAILNGQVSDLNEALYQERDANKVQGFSESHSSLNGDFEVALTELQNDNSYLTLEKIESELKVEELRSQLGHYAGIIKQHSEQSTSERSKPPLKTLALQYQIYKTQHEDDSLRNFLRRSNYCISQIGKLRQYFDDECEMRLVISKERQLYRKWSTRDSPAPCREARQTYVKAKFEKIMAPKRAMFKERSVYIGWGNRTTTLRSTRVSCAKNSTAYAGKYDVRPRYHWSVRMDYYQWWMDNLTPEEARHRALLTTKTAKVIKAGLKIYRSVSKVMNYELSPTKRNEVVDERKAKAKARRLSIKKQQVKCSKIKRAQEEAFERDEELQTIREAMRIAH